MTFSPWMKKRCFTKTKTKTQTCTTGEAFWKWMFGNVSMIICGWKHCNLIYKNSYLLTSNTWKWNFLVFFFKRNFFNSLQGNLSPGTHPLPCVGLLCSPVYMILPLWRKETNPLKYVAHGLAFWPLCRALQKERPDSDWVFPALGSSLPPRAALVVTRHPNDSLPVFKSSLTQQTKSAHWSRL